MSLKFLFVIFGGIVLTLVDNARTLPRVKRQSLKVRITAKDDSIIIKYLSSNPATFRLQGYILGYGGRQSKQNITLPDNGDPFEVDVEFNPRYLIAVHPVAEQSKTALKKCKGNLNHQKPPQITISTRTATSVFLTWTNGIKGNVYKHGGHDCGDERHYTVRYREKERDKKWLYQCCPTSATTIDNLKPNTVYEFGVRVSKAKEEGTWSEPTNYITAVTSSPPSTGNGQTQKISKKLAINFGNENGKNARIAELPGETNIIGIKDKKGPVASYPAQNGTNWIRFPKKPTVNTHVVLGGPSASDSARDHSTSSSSPKPHIPHQPERAPDHLHGKEGRNKLKSKETSNTVTKPSLKSGKMRNTKEKSKVKPLTTKESKLPSSVSPSFPSKPVPKSDPAEIQIPIFLTPSPPSHLDTTDKQQPTEPVTTPPSTTLPFTILSTTSGHTAVDKQHLPGTTSALDPMETQKFSEPEIPSSSRGSFHPTSDPDAMNNQEFKDHHVPTHSPSVFSLISGYKLLVTDTPYVFTPVIDSKPTEIAEKEVTDHHVPTHSPSVFSLISEDKLLVTDTPYVFTPVIDSKPTEIAEKEVTADHEVPVSDTHNVVSSVSTNELPVTDSPYVLHAVPGSEPAKIGKDEFTADHEVTTSDTHNQFNFISDNEMLITNSPNVLSLIPDSESANIEEKEITADHEVPTPYAPNVFSLISQSELPVTDIPNVFKPMLEPEPAEIADKEGTDSEVQTPDTRNVLHLLQDYELPVSDPPYLFSSIPEFEPSKIVKNEVTDYMMPVTDAPNIVSADPESKSANIRKKEVTGHEVLTSDTPSMFNSVTDYELSITDSPSMLKPIPEPETTKIGKDKITDHEVPTSNTRNVFSSIPESERAKIGKKEVTADYEVPISYTRYGFSSTSDNEPLVTDTPNVFNPIPQPKTAKIGTNEDFGFSTSDTAIMPSPSPIYETGEKELTGLKLPTSEISHEFIPTSVSELDLDKKFPDNKLTHPDSSHVFIPTLGNIEDTEFTVRKLPKSDTPRKFSSTPVSELDNKEDEEFTEHKLPTSGTPDVLIQSQESALDKVEDKDFTEYLFPTSDTPHVRSSTSVQPPFDSNGKMLTESDPPSDRSPIITSKRVQKPDMKQKFPELETQSPGGHLSSTVPGNTQESSPVFRSTPVSNIDGQGQERFRGTYVKYLTKQDRPCSITESLKHFPHENITNNKATAPPRYPPSNLTLVTVEGCPTFLIVDWESNENDTASEYEVVSTMQSMDNKTEELITVTNQTHTAVENLKPNTSYTFSVTATNIHGKGPSSVQRSFVTESADPSVSEYVPGKDAIWTQYSFKFDSYSECQGKQFVKRTRYRKFVGIILCNSLRYKIYLSNSLSGIFYNIGDLSGHGEDHCQFVDSFLDGRTGEHLLPEQLPIRQGFYRSVRQEPVMFGTIGGRTHINYVHWYECGIAIPGQW
ncbi:target of Nesh-SH3-like isoform X21 [Hemiscyllium ocellatum]|uniref:target of Nesh-SH3-like isoform X21 n=1 Tax=Hemiscyllium ocellatum TaxID=170820 RepID=UPI00296662D8|nr:target of Nesh-SH3-like isoform X21 [Hemiscyllium ocellatum]